MEHDGLAIKLSSVLQSERTFFYHGWHYEWTILASGVISGVAAH